MVARNVFREYTWELTGVLVYATARLAARVGLNVVLLVPVRVSLAYSTLPILYCTNTVCMSMTVNNEGNRAVR